MCKACWAMNACPEMAYMLKRYDTECAFLAHLNVNPKTVRIVKHESRYMLSPDIQKAWHALETSLMVISTALLSAAFPSPEAKFSVDSPFWPLPSERGYRHLHKDEYSARKAAALSRDACALLVARCTLAIALVTTDPKANPPQWYTLLADKGVPLAWIDMLRDSVVADLSPGLRVGAFIRLAGQPRTAWINHVPCMIRANLPVYLAWWPGPQHADVLQVLREFPFLQAYVPTDPDPYIVPVHLHLQSQTFFRWPPRPDPLSLIPIVEAPLPIPCGQRQHPGESFFDFLARRDRLHAEKERSETTEHQTARLEREKQAALYARPSRRTGVFLWKTVGEVDGNLPHEYLGLDYRSYVDPRAVGELWDMYPNSQKRYDAWSNEWDICVQLAPDDEVVDPQDHLYEYEPPMSQELPMLLSTTIGHHVFEDDLHRFYEGDQDPDRLALTHGWCPRFERAHDLTYFRYGLIQAIAEGSAINYREYNALQVQKIFGMTETEINPADIGLVQPLSALVTSMLSDRERPRAPGLIWDLNPSSDLYLRSRKQSRPYLRIERVVFNRVTQYCVRYEFPDEVNTRWWDLLVDAATALELYRRKSITCSMEAVEFLVDRGIPCHTIYKPDPRRVPRLLLPAQTVLGWRPTDFAPTAWDYLEYECRVHALVSQPKGRAALLRGGIVWRLAVEVLGGDWRELPLAGPSEDIYDYGQAFVPERGDNYYDDALSSDELDVICGVYKVYTTNWHFSQTQDFSWWPKADTWEKSDLNKGYWTPYCEQWFQERLDRIRNNATSPRTAKKWSDGLKRIKVSGPFHTAIQDASAQFLAQEFGVPAL
ncbi:hypothetical protein GSI_11765 [Ganoderma sinense ZZ0214-1]|uniref:Uncharacterized protein n=1 Tax=Ganoderma sinense ZZ0214-1 TaxID=1077348 RepID=A0A2G8RWW7_9APHY|nr:hypothetical protein GSI_11765 [Ganoderma sinense ZZ0214-1]